MGYLEILDGDEVKLPNCCRACARVACYYPYELDNRAAYYCTANLFLPTAKQACKRRLPMPWEVLRPIADGDNPEEVIGMEPDDDWL